MEDLQLSFIKKTLKRIEDYILVCDLDFIIVSASKGFLRDYRNLFSKPLIGSLYSDVFPTTIPSGRMEHYKKAQTDESFDEVFELSFKEIVPALGDIPLRIEISRIGNFIQFYFRTHQNLQTLQHVVTKQTQEVQIFQQALNFIMTPVFLIQENGDIHYKNPCGQNFLSESSVNILDQLEETDIVHQEIQESLRLKQNLNRTLKFYSEMEKEIRIFNILFSPISSSHATIHTIVILDDITHQALERKKQSQKNTDLIKILNTASHEMRTPITEIHMAITLIRSHYNKIDVKTFEKYCDQILRSTERLILFTNKTEEMIRLEKHMTPAEKIPLYKKLFWLIQTSRYVDSIELKELKGADEFFISFSSECLTKCIGELLQNASIFSHKERDLTIEITVEQDPQSDAFVLVHIKDNGKGIPSDDIPSIYDPLFRGSNAGALEGLGTGLYMVRQYMKYYNGKIRIQSILGETTTITLKFLKYNHKDLLFI